MPHPFDSIPLDVYKDLSLIGLGTESWFGVFTHSVGSPRRRIVGDCWLLLAVESGGVNVKLGGDQVDIRTLECTLLPPGVTYWEHTCVESRVARLPIKLLTDPGLGTMPFPRIPMTRQMPFADKPRARGRLKRLGQIPNNRARKTVGQCLEGDLLVKDLFLNALAGGYARGTLEQTPPSSDWVFHARKQLEEEFRNPSFTISALAQRVGKSREELQRRFQTEFGMTPKDWLHRYRIRMAVQFLHSHPHLTVESVMLRCGYRSRSLFYTMFTRFEGVSPGSLRNIRPTEESG